jgi:hypothetical protein
MRVTRSQDRRRYLVEKVCIKRVGTGSCVNKRFGLVSKKFGGEVFIIDVFDLDRRFGFGKWFGQEVRAAPWVTWLALR